MDFSGIDPPNGSLGRGVAIVEVVNHVKFTCPCVVYLFFAAFITLLNIICF